MIAPQFGYPYYPPVNSLYQQPAPLPQQQPVQQQIRSGGIVSVSGDYSGRYSRDEAKDKLIDEMEGMMGDVSPEAQHAIQKAIHALGQE